MKLAAVWRDSWILYWTHFGLILAIVATIYIPCDLFASYMEYQVFGEDDFRKSFKLVQFLENFIGIIASSAVTFLIFASDNGRKVGYGASMEAGFRFWGKMWLTRFLSGLLLILGILLLILPGIYFLVRSILAETVVIREGVYGWEAIKRSFALTKGHFWMLLGAGLVMLGAFLVILILILLPPIFMESLNLWWVDGLQSFVLDLAAAFATVFLVSLYNQLVSRTSLEEGSAEFNNIGGTQRL